MLAFPLTQGDSWDRELRGRFMVKSRKSLSKVKKTRVLTEKGSFLLLQEICVYAYIDLNVVLSTVRAIFGVEYHCFWGHEKGRKWVFCEISLFIII